MNVKNYIALSVFCSMGAFAQVTVDMKADIEQVLLDPLSGNVLVEDKDNVSCVNGQTNELNWSFAKKDYASITTLEGVTTTLNKIENNDFLNAFNKDEEVTLIPQSPFAAVRLEHNDLIVNSATGEVVFNSAEMQYRILQTYYLIAENNLLILGVKDSTISFLNYDLASKKVLWSNDLGTLDSLGKSLGQFV